MAGEDFFLKFGSNADEFARNVRDDVSQARRQIDLLTRAVRELESATRSSSAASNLISGLREDLRSMSSGLARDLGQQLRSALQRELTGLNINVGATVDPDVRSSGGARTDRTSAANTPEADRLAAQAQRQMGSSVNQLRNNLDRLSRVMGEQESKLRSNFDRMSQQQQQALTRLFGALEAFQARINAVRADPAAGVDAGIEARELAQLSSDIHTAITNSLRTGMLQISRDLQMRIAAETGEHRQPPPQRGPASATAREEASRVEIDPVVVRDMAEAGSKQLQAAEELRTGIGRFETQVNRFAAAVSNMQVAGGAATGAEAATDARQQQRAAEQIAETVQRAAQAPPPQARPALTDDDITTRKAVAAAQLTQIGKRFTPEHSTTQILEEAESQVAKLRDAFGGDMDAVARVVDDFQQGGQNIKSTMASLDQELELLRTAARQAQESTREVAQSNAQSAQARREEAVTARAVNEATQDVARAERNAANARDAEARAAAAAASETAGTPAQTVPRDTATLNREVNRRMQRQRDLQSILTGEYASGGAFDIDPEVVPAEQRRAASEEARARREQAGIATVDRQRLFEEAFDQLVPRNIEGEARSRLRDVFFGVGDEAVAEARQYLREVSSRGVPAISSGAMQAMFSQIVDTSGARDFGVQDDATVATDAALQRQRRRSRALELLPVLEQGTGSIEAATRGGSLAALNERLRGVGFEGEVSSRAEGADVLNRLRADLDNIIGGMTGRDREDFRRLAEMPDEERRATAQRLRSAADELAQAGSMIQAAIRSGAIQPPTGVARHPDILQREFGEGAGEAGDPRRRRIAEMTDIVRLAEARDTFEAAAVAQQFSALGASLEEVESLTTDNARQGRIKRLALEALDANDQALVDRYRDLPDGSETFPQVQAAMQRHEERSRRAVEDRLLMERQMEVSAARGEGAQERTERVRRGGLQSLARWVEIPEEALRAGAGGGRGMRYLPSPERTVHAQDRLAETFGRGHPLVASLTDMFNTAAAQAVELNQQRLLRGEALSALSTAEAFREQNIPVDERQVAAAQRIKDRTEGVERDLQNALRQLFVPEAATEDENLRRVLQGQSLSDFFYDPSRPPSEVEGEDPRTTRVMAARMEAKAQALAQGIENVTDVVTAAGNAAGRAYDEEVADRESATRIREGLEGPRQRAEEAARVWAEGSDPEAAAQAAEVRRESLARAERRAAPFIGREDDIRAAARGVATPEQMGSLVEALGGFDEAVRRIASQRGAGAVRTDEQIAAGLKDDLRVAPERLAEAEARLSERRNEVVQQRLAVEEAQLDFDTAANEEQRRAATTRLDAEQRRLSNIEGAIDYGEREVEAQRALVAEREGAIQNARVRSEEAERIQTQVRRELEAALRPTAQIGDAADDMVTVYRGMAEPFDPARAADRGVNFTTDRDYALQNTNRERHPYLYEMQVPRSRLIQSDFPEAGPGGAVLRPEEAAQARLVQGDVLDQLRNTATRLSESDMPKSIGELRALLRQVAQAGQVSTEEAERVTSTEQLLARIQQLAGSVEENTAATQGNTSAEQQNTAATQRETAASVGAGGRRATPTFDLPRGGEELLQVRSWLAGEAATAPGFSRSQENLFTRARELEGADPSRAVSTVRNMLARLAGPDFEMYGRDAQNLTTSRSRIDDRLIVGAEEGIKQTLAAIGQMDLGETERQVAERDYPAQIISVLTQLEGTMSELIICCKAMQRMAGRLAGGGGGDVDMGGVQEGGDRLATQRAAGPQVAEMVTGELNRRVVEAIGRSEVARRGGDTAGARRALSEAAMEIMADPNVGPALRPGQVVAGVQTLADRLNEMSQASGVDPYRLGKEDLSAVRADVNAATRLQGMDPRVMEAFRSGDMAKTGEAMVRATGDVDGAMRELVQIFSLDAQAAGELRASLAALQQELVDTNASAQQRQAAEAAANEPLYARMVREDNGRRLAPEAFDINAPVTQNAPLVAEEMIRRDPTMELSRVLANLKAVFGQLDDATLRVVQAKVQEAQASERARLADEAEAAASQRAASLGELLPLDERRRFQESIGAGARGEQPTITPQEVTSRVERITGGQVRGSATITRAIQRMFDGVDLDNNAARHVDQYVESARASMQQYQTPFQQFLGELWSGRGFASSVARTMGNFVSRYVGGAIVFGLAAQFRELTSQALETEQTFIRITAALDATSRSAQGVRSELQDIAVETNTNISDTYEVMAQLVGVFETTEEALNATRVIGQLELISQGALSAREGFRALSAVVSTWQETLMEERGLDQTGAITYVADLATRIQDLTGVNIEDTTEGLARLGETAKALGIEMELIATAVGVTAKTSGQTGQAASEQIGRILANFQNAGTTDVLVGMGITDAATVRAGDFNQVLTDLFENYNTLGSAQRRQVANLIGDPRQFALTNALLSNGAEALEVYEQSLNSAGAAAERQDQILGTLRGQIGQLGKEVQVLVQNLIDLGILNVFGVLIKGASLFLDPLNSILDILNNLKDASPFTRMLVDLGLTIAGFKLLMGLMGGAMSQMTRMAGLGEVTGVRSAISMGREMFRPRVAAGAAAETAASGLWVPSSARDRAAGRTRNRFLNRQLAPNTVMLGPEPGALRAGAARRFVSARERLNASAMGQRVNTSRPGMALSSGAFARGAAARGQRLSNGLRAATGGLGRFVSSIGMASLGMSLLIDAMQQGTQELHDFAQGLAEQRDTDRQRREASGETEEETTRRTLRENLDEARNMGWWDRMGESSRHMFSSPGNFFKRTVGNVANLGIPFGLDPTGAGSALSGALPDDVQATLDQQFQEIVAVSRNGGTVEDAAAIRDRILEDYQEVIDSLPTATQKLEAELQMEGQLQYLDTVTDNLIAANSEIIGAADFTAAQIEALMQSYQFVSSLDNQSLARYGEAISAILNSSQTNLPDEAQAALSSITGSGSYSDRLNAQSQAMELAYNQALVELEQAEGEGHPDKIDEATQALQQIVATRAQLDQAIMDAALSLPQQFAELYMRTGDYDAAQRSLSAALQEARRQANTAAEGSPEQVAALEAQLDILRQSAEASIAQEVASLEMASIGERDPLAALGNELAIARLRLQTAIDNPGAYTPEEIRGFMQEIAQLQQQAMDEQQAIADAMTALAVEQERNPIRQAHLEYAAALNAYNRALEQGLGAQEVLSRAQEVESTARNVRERNEELRSATADARIAGMPQGDEVAISMAELAEAYNRQANIIREFGRDSAEFQDSLSDVLEGRRAVEDAVNAVFEATTELASSLAEAAGMDIEASRIQADAAVSNLNRAVEQAGGNMQAASVRQAMAEAMTAQANLRDTVLGEALDTINFMEEMGDITSNQAISALQEILNTMDLTEDQRRDILRQIQGLQDSINDALSGGFNIAEVRIPTPYEVRRSLGIDAITEGVEEGRAAMEDAFEAVDNATSGGGGDGILDQVLGPDLAAEVRSVGDGVGDLLPPISEIPRIIDETVASRDAVVAELRENLNAMMAVRDAQNASVAQLGATISVPANLIADATAVTRDYTVLAKEALDIGNTYLANLSEQTGGVIGAINALPAAISSNLIAALREEQERGHAQPRYAPDGPGSSYGLDPHTGRPRARAFGGPVSAYQAYKVGEYGEELFVPNTSGYIVKASDFTPLRDPAMGGGGTTINNNRFDISVAVKAETNADANEIARTVERRVSNSLRRSMGANQSTPHMVRMR